MAQFTYFNTINDTFFHIYIHLPIILDTKYSSQTYNLIWRIPLRNSDIKEILLSFFSIIFVLNSPEQEIIHNFSCETGLFLNTGHNTYLFFEQCIYSQVKLGSYRLHRWEMPSPLGCTTNRALPITVNIRYISILNTKQGSTQEVVSSSEKSILS